MKIIYGILCHKDPKHIERLANKLTLDQESEVLVHVDLKTNINPFLNLLNKNKQVHFIEKRVNVFWGGYSSIKATLNIMEVALTFKLGRFVLLQGLDYPILSNQEIQKYFNSHPRTEFIKAYNITKSMTKNDYMKCCGYHLFDGVNRNKLLSLRTILARVLELVNRIGVKYRKGYYYDRKERKKYDIYWGWAHISLTRECMKYVVLFSKTHPDFNKYFRHIFPPDETYFQTILYNSFFCNESLKDESLSLKKEVNANMYNLTYFEYPDKVKIFKSISDYNKLKDSGCLFFRKVDSSSNELLDFIDKKHNDLINR